MLRRSVTLATLFVAFTASVSRADVLAVLPLNAMSSGLDASGRETLEESIRTIAGDVLSPRGYTVLTGENTLQVLADNGIDPSKACEASCALQVARELKASLFISGSVSRTEGYYFVFIRLFEQKSGRQLASVRLQSQTIRGVEAEFEKQAADFFARGFGQPTATAAPVAPAPVVIAPPPPAAAPSSGCEDGKERMSGMCCFPGQVVTENACHGLPSKCPSGFRPSGESCVSLAPAPAPTAVSSTPAPSSSGLRFFSGRSGLGLGGSTGIGPSETDLDRWAFTLRGTANFGFGVGEVGLGFGLRAWGLGKAPAAVADLDILAGAQIVSGMNGVLNLSAGIETGYPGRFGGYVANTFAFGCLDVRTQLDGALAIQNLDIPGTASAALTDPTITTKSLKWAGFALSGGIAYHLGCTP